MASIGQAPSSPLATSGSRFDGGSSVDGSIRGGGGSSGGFAGGLASLLRSAGRKSTESLRSVRSSASFSSNTLGGGRRKSFGSSRKNKDSNQGFENFEPVPPLPISKDTPPSSANPMNRGHSSAGQSVSSLQSLEPPEPSRPATNNDMTRQASNRSMSRQAQVLHGLEEEGPEDALAPLPSDVGHNGTPSRTMSISSSSLASRAKSARRGLGGLGSKMGLPSSGSNNQDLLGVEEADGAKTPTGRTTPTQSDPYGRSGNASATNNGASQPQGGDGNTVAQLYAVFGLPKDPSVWTLAEEDCVAGVHHMEGAVGRFWRPEVLGCSICPSPAEIFAKQANKDGDSAAPSGGRGDAEKKWEGRSAADGKKGSSSSNPKFIEMADGRGRIEKAETARVLSKALKLSFTREIEIVSGQNNYPPMATSHTFSFSVPTLSSASGESLDRAAAGGSSSDLRKGTGAVGVGHHKPSAATGEGYGMVNGGGGNARTTGFEESAAPATFYGVVLTVWSAADDRRAKAIKKELNRAAKQRGGKDKKSSRDEDGAEGGEGFLPANNAYFMPYAICIISRYPLYDLLGDWNKWAWHKYSRNIEMHNKLMSIILSKPAPRLGSKLVVDATNDGDVAFSTTFPGALEWGTGLIGIDFTMWPLFKTLSLDNILTICEIALAPNGRVLFMSRHPALLGLAVETIKYFVELRGWQGVANQNCHARDVKIYLEDPGTWIISISTELRSIVKPAKEVCVVDLDINYVNCPSPPAGAPSTKGLREKRKRKLVNALGFSTGDFRPPREYIEAYPGGRFRPMSNIIPRDAAAYDQLERPIWWDQSRVITAFDKTLHDGSRPSPLVKLLRMRATKNRTTSEAELAAILALRKRASTFVDARDGLENKIGRLNKRLAFLMSESEMWKAQFSKIQQLVDRLTKEANETRAKLDKERRESRRLSSTLAQRDMERVQLQVQLKETEDAREAAQAELLTMQRAMDSLEHEREAMMDEIRGIISGAGGDGDDVAFNMSRLDLYNESVGGHGSSRASSPTGSQSSASMTPSQAADRILKARKAAEDRINEGQPSSRSRSRLAAPASSTGHASTSRHHGNSPPSSSAGNHFPEDQMNYEIQKRTSSVTDQIARIQAQLENTLNHLEDRSRSHRSRRTRRDSTGSFASSSRYEHRTPSSLGGHGGAGGGGATDTESMSAHNRGGEESELDYESSATTGLSGYDSAASAARRERRRRRDQRRADGPPTSYRGPGAAVVAPEASAGDATAAASTSAPASSSSSPTATRPRPPRAQSREQILQERDSTNAWKAASGPVVVAPPASAGGSSSVATHDSDAPTMATATADTVASTATAGTADTSVEGGHADGEATNGHAAAAQEEGEKA